MRQQKYGTRFPQRSTPHARSTVERDIFGVEARLPSLHSNPLPSSYALLHGMVGRINSTISRGKPNTSPKNQPSKTRKRLHLANPATSSLSLSLSLPPLRIRPPRGFGRASASLPSKPESSAKRRISARLRRRLPSRSRAAKIEDFRSSRRLRSERTGRRRRFGGVSGGEEKGRHTPRVSDVGELIQGEMCVRGLEDGKMKIKIMNKNTSNWIMIHTKIYIILYVRVCCIIHCNPGCTQLISNGGW